MAVSLEDALLRCDLTPQQLDFPISFKQCVEFSEKLTEWEPLAPRLDLTDTDIATIKHDHPLNLRSQCSACLTKWQGKLGSQATFLKLAQALKETESMNRVEKLIDIFKTVKLIPAPPSDLVISSEVLPVASGSVNERVHQFEERFRLLVENTLKELGMSGKIPVQVLKFDVTLLPNDIKRNHATYITQHIKELKEVEDVTEFFLLLNAYWDHFNYTLLEVLVKKHGSAELQERMKAYISDVQRFWRETTVDNFLTSCGNRCWLQRVPKEFTEIKCIIDKPVTELTLYDVEQYRLQFSQNLQLREFVLILHKLDRSSLEITWLLDVGLVPQLKRVVWSDLRKFLEGTHVKQVVVDGESAYQLPQSPSPHLLSIGPEAELHTSGLCSTCEFDSVMVSESSSTSTANVTCYQSKTPQYADVLEKCIITLENFEEDGIVVLKMPCGHPISPQGLVGYCLNRLNANMNKLYCPVCSKEWTLDVIKQCRGISEDEFKKLEKQINRNLSLNSDECLKEDGPPALPMPSTDKYNQWVLISCKHPISSGDLVDHCWSELNANKTQVCCPICAKEWTWSAIKQSGGLSQDESKKLEEQISLNFILNSGDIKECPKCKSFCSRTNENIPHVACRMCSYFFCWHCLCKWDTPGISHDNCKKLQWLKNSEKVVIQSDPRMEVYQLRACPYCGEITHCTNESWRVQCSKCETRFCCVCLQAESQGTWSCGTAAKVDCVLAPVQTKIPCIPDPADA